MSAADASKLLPPNEHFRLRVVIEASTSQKTLQEADRMIVKLSEPYQTAKETKQFTLSVIPILALKLEQPKDFHLLTPYMTPQNDDFKLLVQLMCRECLYQREYEFLDFLCLQYQTPIDTVHCALMFHEDPALLQRLLTSTFNDHNVVNHILDASLSIKDIVARMPLCNLLSLPEYDLSANNIRKVFTALVARSQLEMAKAVLSEHVHDQWLHQNADFSTTIGQSAYYFIVRQQFHCVARILSVVPSAFAHVAVAAILSWVPPHKWPAATPQTMLTLLSIASHSSGSWIHSICANDSTALALYRDYHCSPETSADDDSN